MCKAAATREFLDWLVATLKILPDKDGRIGIDTLTGKSKLADYAGDYQKGEPPLEFEELLDILQKNKRWWEWWPGGSVEGQVRGEFGEGVALEGAVGEDGSLD